MVIIFKLEDMLLYKMNVSNRYAREEMLDIIKRKGEVTHYTTRDILDVITKYVKTNGSTKGLSFAGENLTGIDLSRDAIQEEIKRQGYSEEQPPPWYSGDLKQQELRKRPEIIASARNPNAIEVVSKRGVNLEGVDFSNAILVCANFEGADLVGANFHNAKLYYANFSYARLWDANFTAARLNNATFTGAALQNTDFTKANLNDAIFDKCLLYHAYFKNTEIKKEQIKEIWEEKMAKKIQNGYLFDVRGDTKKIKRELDDNIVSEELLNNFIQNGFSLSKNVIVKKSLLSKKWILMNKVKKKGLSILISKFDWSSKKWVLIDKVKKKKFTIQKKGEKFTVYGGGIRKPKRDSRVYYNAASVAYNRLKNNFVSIGRHNDAGWAFIKEKRMERKTFRVGAKRFFSWFMDISCGYGEQPWKVIILSLFVVILFGFLYLILDGLKTDINIAIRWHDYFVFSLRNFVTLGLPDIKPFTFVIKTLSSIEAAFGIGLFALLMYSFGRRLTGR